jgi:hypothetical protein
MLIQITIHVHIHFTSKHIYPFIANCIHSLYFLPLSGNYFNKKDKTAMVAQDYGFIDAPPSSKPNNSSAGSNNRQQATVVNNNSGIQTKETIGNHNSSNANHSRAGKFIHV